jgi:DNA-binding CsgD family transcriptional regulator
LLGATAYHAGEAPDRAAAHRALAATAPDDRRRAWHLAAAATDADARTAQALVAVAHAARALGGHAEAGEAFARAAELTADAQAGDGLRLEAAQDLAVAGDAERALALVDAAAGEDDDGQRRAQVAGLRGHLRLSRGDPAGAHRVLEAEAARQLEGGDPVAAARLLLDSVVALSMTGDRLLMDRAVARLQDAAARTGGPIALLAQLTVAQHRVAGGDEAEGRACLDAALPGLESLDPVAFAEPLALTAQCLLWLWDTERAIAIIEPLVDQLQAASALGRLAYPLCVRAHAALAGGQLAAAHADADAAVRLAHETGQDTMLSYILPIRGRAAALLGDLDAAREDVARALVLCDRGGAHAHAAYAHAVLGAVELAAGRPETAVAPLERAAALGEVAGLYNPALTAGAGDLVEALAQAGRVEQALERAEPLRGAQGAWAAAVAARCALWSDAEGDAALVAVARDAAERLGAPLEVARTELAIAARAARARRFGAARGPLLAARDAFARLGARAWRERADDLLAAIGESGSVQTLAELTEDERRLAVLASRGLTTDELAGMLHVGPKTVERRLGAVFRKLGVASRPALARLVTDARREGVP